MGNAAPKNGTDSDPLVESPASNGGEDEVQDGDVLESRMDPTDEPQKIVAEIDEALLTEDSKDSGDSTEEEDAASKPDLKPVWEQLLAAIENSDLHTVESILTQKRTR